MKKAIKTTRKTTAKKPVKHAAKRPAKATPANKQNQTDWVKWGSRALAAVVGLSYLVGVGAVDSTGIIPARYLFILIPLSLIIVGWVVISLARGKQHSKAKSIVLLILSLLIVTGSGYAYALSRSTTHFLDSIQSTSGQSTGTVITKPYVVYISGIDTYGDVSTVSRSDVNIMAVVNPMSKKVLLVNTPRDYYVQLHGTTGVRDKLTHAGIYGIGMSKATLEDLYGVKIDYTVRVNFTSLLKVIDAVGGVDVYSDYAFSAGGYNFVQGTNTLDAKQALAFSRERHSFTDGDRQRGKDQQRVIEALIAKLGQPTTLVSYQQVLKSLEGTFQTNASSAEIGAIIKQQLSSVGSWQTKSISVDGTGSTNVTYSMGAQPLYVMEPDMATVNAAKAEIQTYKK